MGRWMRGGTSPEVRRTTFEYSPDGGSSWANLGTGIRIPGGWLLTGAGLPNNTTIRARGFVQGPGSWFVETVLRPALAIADVHYSTNGQFGFTASGPLGQVAVIESSPDLQAWTPLQTNTLAEVPLPFTDAQPRLPSRFYRVRSGQ